MTASPSEQRPVILIICKGNIFRSPVAAAKLRQMDAKDDLDVRSAGVVPPKGKRIDDYPSDVGPATDALQAVGLDLGDHTARMLTLEDLEQASMVFVLKRDVLNIILEEFPGHESKLHLQ